MASPCFRRYWQIEYDDGSISSQFDENGEFKLWNPTKSIKYVRFIPINEEFAKKIISRGGIARATNLPSIVIEIPVGSFVEYHRDCKITWIPRSICNFCGKELLSSNDSCPQCFSQNWWYCDICDKLIDDPLLKQEYRAALCPDCWEEKVIRGLVRICAINDWLEEVHEQVHVIEFADKRHIILEKWIK